MGKQIIYYMDEKVKNDFLEFLQSEGYSFAINNFKKKEVEVYNDYKRLPNNMFILYLHKNAYGKIYVKQEMYVDASLSPVIECIKTSVDHSKKEIYSGRLWVSTGTQVFDDSNSELIFKKDYSKLVRWIKKHVPYQTIAINGNLQKWYINEEMLELFNEGYRLM